ncbi:unnamed protein product [Trichobilharzia regenti]|nr:unnamed protein product [Trichobilharzia regenti]
MTEIWRDEAQVRTLFVSGLPLDAKSRELYLLFRSFKVSVGVIELGDELSKYRKPEMNQLFAANHPDFSLCVHVHIYIFSKRIRLVGDFYKLTKYSIGPN